MKNFKRLIQSLVPNELESTLSKHIGRRCYLKTKKHYKYGSKRTIGIEVDGQEVCKRWPGGNPVEAPDIFTVKHLQKDYRGETLLRIYSIHGDEIGTLVEPDEVIFLD